MTMTFSRGLTTLALALVLLLLGGAGAGPAAAEAEKPPAAAVYEQDIPEMTTLECAKCHPQVFKTIRDRGGLHQIECQECHVTFHNFKEGLSWEERMPACSNCHEAVHGESYPECYSCHRNAHAPVASLVGVDQLAGECDGCHGAAVQSITKHPSAHTELACSECHYESHGYIPGCNECHPEPHAPYEDNKDCTTCHAPHAPLKITLQEGVANRVCTSCHGEVGKKLAQSGKKHQALSCVFCHAGSHGSSATCSECHGKGPHNPELLEKFGECRNCHGDAHGLSLRKPEA